MSTKLIQPIEEPNLSHAWGRAFLHAMDNSKRNLAPLVVSVTGMDDGLPQEDLEIRRVLDEMLMSKCKKYSSKVSALTIFPYDAWIGRGRPSVNEFSSWYLTEFFPRLQGRSSANNRGTYFERMIRCVGANVSKGGSREFDEKNQLKHLVEIWHRDKDSGRSSRRSALQVSIFDPVKDHTGAALLGFPCLQQISFSYDDQSQLAINAYYPTQYIVDRAYGNYLGLCHLGHFMAKEMGLIFVRMNCYIGLPDLGNKLTKHELTNLENLVRTRIPDHNADKN